MAGKGVRVLLDEMIAHVLAGQMRNRNYDVVSVHEVGLGNRSAQDDPILENAATNGLAVMTFNVNHFTALDEKWREAGKQHSGIIAAPELSDVGEMVRRLSLHLDTTEPASQHNQIIWLPNCPEIRPTPLLPPPSPAPPASPPQTPPTALPARLHPLLPAPI
ncbi:MAG: DUF5615 family PIN-like protein [Chloroflexi bacterium]|nr:DUF5615 family PIN-like protein [Chloroflexota bacterium]